MTSELDFWHPVLLSEQLGRKPRTTRLSGAEFVLFRSGDAVGALENRCPHRGMRLSEGIVREGRLVCPYHGWAWARDGAGESPGNPRLCAQAPAFDTLERDGAIWVKRAGTAVPFPSMDITGFTPVGRVVRRVRAPLELVVDNFVEVEHTGQVHYVFGYATEAMADVQVDVTTGDDWVRVYNEGPQRPLPWPLRKALGYPRGGLFVDDWTTRFRPVHAVYDQYWIDPSTRERVGQALRNIVFFNPISELETDVFVFLLSLEPLWGRRGVNLLLQPIVRRLGELEIGADVRAIERLADKSPRITGNQLGRFDKGLIATRNRIDRIYRGGAALL